MRIRNRTAGALACVVATAALLTATTGMAGAATQDAEYALGTGQVTIGANPYTLPAATGIVGTWDDVTGAFDGVFTSEAVTTTQAVTSPLAGTITLNYQFVAASNVTGVIDPVTGAGTLSTAMNVVITLESIALDSDPGNPLVLDQVCTIANVPMNFTATASGGPAPIWANLGLTDSGFAAPTGTCVAGPAGNPALTPTIQTTLNDSVGLPTQQTSADLRFTAGQAPPASTTTTTAAPTTTTTAPTTTTSVAPVAVTAQPSFTG